MCGHKGKKGCQRPENLKDTPGDCSPEQVRRCHGSPREHPCVAAGKPQ
jgi:hypothetical protein